MSDVSNNRRLKPNVAARIRERANRGSDGSSDRSGDGNGGSGSGSGDGSNNGESTTAITTDNGVRDEIGLGSTTGGNDGDTGGIRVIDRTRNGAGSGIGSDGNKRPGTAGNDARATEATLVSGDISRKLEPSLIKVTDVIADSQDGITIITPGARRGRKPGTKNKSKKTVDYSDVIFPLRVALDFVFGIPVQIGWGKHWELSDEENSDLSESIKDVLEAFPSDTTKQFIVAIEKYIPLLTLGITLHRIFKPRFAQTRLLKNEQRKQRLEEIEQAKEGRTSVFTPNDNAPTIG